MVPYVEIRLRNGGPALIDAEDLPLTVGWGWHVMSTGYVGAMTSRAAGAPPRRMVLLHRLLMDPPPARYIDHINGDKLDNRRANLRIVTPTRNHLNRHRLSATNTSGILGVSPYGARWRATIRVAGRQIALGTFDRIEAAAAVRWEAELRYFGELFPLSQQARERQARRPR